MFKVFTIALFLLSVTLGKQIVIITQLKHDKELPIRSSLVTASVGDNVSFRCKINENDASEERDLKWHTTSSTKLRFAENDTSTLVLSPLEQDDAGTYTCVSERRNGSDHVYLFVKAGRRAKDFAKVNRTPGTWSKLNFSENRQRELLTFETMRRLEDNLITSKEIVTVPNYDQFSYWKPELMGPIDIPKIHIDNSDEFKFLDEPKIINSSTYATFKQSVYIVPVTILVILSLVRLCYYLGNRTSVPWQQLNSASTCSHQICAHRRRADPNATCLLTRLDNRLSVLIIRTVAGGPAESAASCEAAAAGEADAPPPYNDVSTVDSPPTYTEAVESMNVGTSSSNRPTNSTAAAM